MRIVWLNNVQAPYREPMLRELSGLVDFEASYFFREEKVRHWEWHDSQHYRSAVVPAWRIPVPPKVARRLDDEVGVLMPGVARRLLAGADAMITQVWWQPAHLQAIVRCRRLGIPYLIYAESTLESRSVSGGPADRLRSWVFRNAGAVIVPGPAAAAAALLNGAPKERIVESVNSVDLDLYGTEVRRLRMDADAGGPHRFACVGQLIPRKNVHSLIRALAALDGDWTLEIAGDGVELERLRALARDCGVIDQVSFLGFLDGDQVLALLARSHTLVLASTEEVYGFTALEAHIAGVQVVVSDRAGVAASLTGRPRTWATPPTTPDLTRNLDAARRSWSGWNDDVDVDLASPRRAARDIVSAAEAAIRSRSGPRRTIEADGADAPVADARNASDDGADPAVSVCIPLYMKERFVAATIRSILDQTFSDFELVILHNASPDGSAEVAESFDDPRIRLYHNTRTVPGPENIARLVLLTRAPLVKIVAADDLLHPTALEKQVAVLHDEEIALVSCRQNMIGEFGEIVCRDRSLRTPDLVGRQDHTTVLRRVVRHGANPIGAFVNVLFRRSAYAAAGGMPDVPFIALDLALWLNVIEHGDFFGMPETLVDFRIADGSASASSGRSGVDLQVRYIQSLRRANHRSVRWTDTAYGAVRTPLMKIRHSLIIAAAGPTYDPRARVATAILGLSRGRSGA